MLRNKYVEYATLCLISTVLFLNYNRFLNHLDFLIVFFLIYLSLGQKFKDFVYYIFISGLFFDYLYKSYFGVGFFIFYVIFIFKNYYNKFFTSEKAHIHFPFVIISILFYKYILLVFVTKAQHIEVFKFLISTAIDLFTYYLANFYLVRHKLVISKAWRQN